MSYTLSVNYYFSVLPIDNNLLLTLLFYKSPSSIFLLVINQFIYAFLIKVPI